MKWARWILYMALCHKLAISLKQVRWKYSLEKTLFQGSSKGTFSLLSLPVMFLCICWAQLAIGCSWLVSIFSQREASILTIVRICPCSNIYFLKSIDHIMDITFFHLGFKHLRKAIIIIESSFHLFTYFEYNNLFHLCFYLILKFKLSIIY